jgi:membrane protease YdiL (CAAX protease family)
MTSADAPSTTLPGDATGAARPLRRAPEQREMAVIGGLAFFLNLFLGSILQVLNFRWGLLITQTLFIAGPGLIALRWFYLDPRAVVPLRRPRPGALAGAVLGILGLNHLLTLYGSWQDRVFPMPEALRQLWEALLEPRGVLDYAVLLLLLGPLPAFCEEVLFRGFLQAGFVHAFESPVKGIAVTAVVFAVFHFDPWRFVGVLALGLFLGILAYRTGSLLPSMLAHALNNVVAIVLANAGDPAVGALRGSIASVAVSVILLLLAALLLRRATP